MPLVSLLLALALLAPQTPSQTEYLNLAIRTIRNPVTHDELRDAVLAPDGVAAIRAVFERSLEDSLSINGALITPELGGESMLTDERTLELVVYPDPVHPVIRRLVEDRGRPETLLETLQSSAEGRFLLKNTGGLHALLYQMTDSPTDAQTKLLDDVIEHAVAQHFKTWTTDPKIQAEMIEKTRWRGRYAGFWHIHPPRLSGSQPADGIEPSMADMRNAIDLGQFLTIVYQPDGFDVYDLSPLAREPRENLQKALTIRYRSQEWPRHFEAKFERARGADAR